MAQSVMTGVIDGTFAGYGLRLAPDSEMPVIRDFRAKSIWLSELVELGKSDTPRFYAAPRSLLPGPSLALLASTPRFD
jgi:hypothetical protein